MPSEPISTKPSFRLIPEVKVISKLQIGASRFGGFPDLPKDFEWPERARRRLDFLAQIDLSEHIFPSLPDKGWLLFFYDNDEQPWGIDINDHDGFAVRFVDAERSSLVRELGAEYVGDGFVSCSLKIEAREDPCEDEPQGDDGTDLYAFAALKLAQGDATSTVDEPYHHLLGHAQTIQGPMQSQLDDVFAPSAFDEEATRRFTKGDWTLLLQLDSDEAVGFEWGDMGRLYFWIRAEDLAARAFERSWLILQCC